MRVPEFQAVNFRMVKKGGWVICIKGGNDKQEELRKMLEKAWEDHTRWGVASVKGDKEFLEVQY